MGTTGKPIVKKGGKMTKNNATTTKKQYKNGIVYTE
jgi:hypothetical protein